MEKVVDVKLAITIDDDLISKEDILRGIDEILKCSDGVHAWGEITKERDEILHITESIEGYTETWDTHESHADFETFQWIYERLCELIGKVPKDLAEPAEIALGGI